MFISTRPSSRFTTTTRTESTSRSPTVSSPSTTASTFEQTAAAPVSIDPSRDRRTAAAIDDARTLLTRGRPSWGTQTIENSTVTNDAPKVNDRADVNGRRGQQARTQLLDNAPLERDALMRLSPADQERYQTVKDALLEPAPGRRNGDPVAALALQTTLLEGGLPGDRALGGSDTLLSGLEHMATQEVAPGIDRQQLLSDVVQEVATPQAVAQSTKGTCMATSIEIQLLRDNPAEYVRLVSGLASPDASVRTAGGDQLAVEPTALTDDTGRSVSQRLLAPALMELGNGSADYDNTTDLHSTGGNGLSTQQADTVLGSLYGRDFAFSDVRTDEERARGTQQVMDELASGNSVVVGLQWIEFGHAVLATGREQRGDELYVNIINPWGREESILASEFQERLLMVNYDPNA